jgi:beta-lactam-binding protein with PASTA domain
MDLRTSFRSALDWLRALARNLYFWGGIGGLLLIGFAVYLLVDAVIMPTYTRHDVATRVPDVKNVSFKTADSLLTARNLQVQRQVGRYNPNVDTGIVVDQTPLPSSKVKPGRRVYLTVNAGEVPTVLIPDLSGMSVREAKNRITSADLVVGTVREDPIPSPYANTITKQEPPAGDSLKEGETVDLWYSTGLGEEEVDVPTVVGYTVAEARDVLLREELRSVVVDTNLTADAESGRPVNTDSLERTIYVRRQGQLPGASVRTGTEIRLFTTPDQETALKRREALQDTTASN